MSTYRPDIDGLRAVSIGLVVAYHAGVDIVAGGYVGVDVFFVVSGYLITSLLIGEFERTGTVSLKQFVARRARRLLPLAGVVLTVTAVLGAWLMAPLQRPRLFDDIRAAALFVANWRFAGQATDYSDVTAADSLVNHWWSLAVEEQFYLVWPLAVLGVCLLARRGSPGKVRAVLAAIISLVVVVSFAVSVSLTNRVGPEAYYVTHARLWELAVGALLAATLTRSDGRAVRVPKGVREVLAAGGVVAIVVAALRYDAATPFPGWAAVVPVAGTAALIAAGSGGVTATGRALGWRPFTLVGNWSYAWYLWHWPVIGLGLVAAQRWQWSVDTDVVIAAAVAVSLALAAVSHYAIENPVRRAGWLASVPRRSMAAGLVAVTLPVAFATTLNATLDDGQGQLVLPAGVVAMTPVEAAADVVALPRSDDCNATIVEDSPGTECVFGDPAGAVDVVLMGDSHAQHWLPALDALGRQESWRIHAFTKSACPVVDISLWNNMLKRAYRECADWHALVRERIAAIPDATIVMVNTHGYVNLILDDDLTRVEDEDEVRRRWAEATRANAERLLSTARRVIRLHDTPWSPEDVPTCLSAHLDDPSPCDFALVGRSGRDRPLIEAEQHAVVELGVGDRYVFVDPTPLVCPDDPCQVVDRTGTIIYRDQHHLTQTFSVSLAEELGRLLSPLVTAS